MDNIYKIYKYTNPENGKVYIGLTKLSLKERAGHQGCKYKGCHHFYNAIQEHEEKLDFFKVEILKNNLTLKEANYWEDYYIQYYDSRNPEKGYNINKGGYEKDEASIEKIREGVKKYWASEASLEQKKPVYCIELDKTYSCAREAAEDLNLDRRSIFNACQEGQRYCGEFNHKPLHWVFLKDATEEKIHELKDRLEKNFKYRVYCIELDKIYNTAKEALQEIGIKGDANNIHRVLNNPNRGCGKHPITKEKLHWKYADVNPSLG